MRLGNFVWWVVIATASACAKAGPENGPGPGDDDGSDAAPPGDDAPPTSCGAPPAVANGSVSAPSMDIGAVATYACDESFVLSGSATATCQPSGTWTAAPTCAAAAACSSPPPAPPNGSVSAPTLTSGSVATYACSSAGILVKGQYSACSNGTWIGATPQCAARLDCVCNGEFILGEPIYAPVANTGMTTNLAAGTTGTILAGDAPQAPLFALLVVWDGWHDGHDGRCQFSTCGACTSGGDSKYYTSCTSVATPRLRCACGGAFSEGDRVVALKAAPGGAAGVTLGQTGKVIAAAAGAPEKMLVEWDGFTGGTDGQCAMATCGRCTPSGTARVWVECGDIGRAP